MRRRWPRISHSALITILLLLLLAATGAAAPQPLIRVGLWVHQTNMVVGSNQGLSIYAEQSGLVGTFTAAQKIVVTSSDSGFVVNGTAVAAKKLWLNGEGSDLTKSAAVEVNRRQYRGTVELQLEQGGKGFMAINVLPLEHYLYGVLAKEMPPDWSQEALKAQAVAARSYALFAMTFTRKHQHAGFDVCATTDCQVYGGLSAEYPSVVRAVDATGGKVAYHQGKVANTMFHNNAGGYTENSEEVWGTYIPYLRAVKDYDQDSPYYRWEKRFTATDLGARLQRGGINIGTILALEVSPLGPALEAGPDRGLSGRVKTIQIIGSAGSVNLTGNKFRQVLGLNSTLFDLKIEIPQNKTMDIPFTYRSGVTENKPVELKLPPAEPRGLLTDAKDVHRFGGKPEEVLVIRGFGFGHGLGMSQWGAKVMAEKNAGVPDYYQQILKHYYQGIVIDRAY